MRKMISLFLLICIAGLAGCAEEPLTVPQESYRSVTQTGQVPDAFCQIVADDAFNGVTAFDNCLLKSEAIEVTEKGRPVAYQVEMMDLYGNRLAAYTCNTDDAYHARTLTATRDGGFLFVLGFSDYAYDQDTWASDKGYASRVIKCDKNGVLQFDTPFDGKEGSAFKYCFEKNDCFYFFGDAETPETKRRGVVSPSDIYMVIVDQNGTVLKEQYIAGSDYDRLYYAEISDHGFILSVSAQSDDGDFEGSNSMGYMKDWIFTVNDNLEITDRQKQTGRDYFDNRLGTKDGQPVYLSDPLFRDFDAGTPKVYIDYSDFYLIVSSNITGEYEHTPPTVSSIWYYSESVYSGYDCNGTLLFRAAVDSSPDYDAYAQDFYDSP